MNNIYDYISYIRDGIQHNVISTNIDNFRVLTAALDIVGDAEDGLYDYFMLNNNNGRGMNYIYVYGAINLMNIESQAVKVITKILTNADIDLTQRPKLDIIRLLRNKILAHPIDLSSSINGYGIIANSLSTFYFSPYSFLDNTYEDQRDNETVYDCVKKLTENKNTRGLTIDIFKLRKEQEEELILILDDVCKKYPIPNKVREEELHYVSIDRDEFMENLGLPKT